MKSVIQTEKQCFICRTTRLLEEHHCFGGNPNRKNSEKYGLKVWLCQEHHQDHKNGVHHNKELMNQIHSIGQEAFEINHSREEFVQIFGRNYII